MIIKVSNTLTVDIKDDLLLQLVVEDLTYDNPLYKEAKKSGRSTRGLTQVLKNFTYVNGSYLLPRGYFERLYILSKELGIHVEIQDERSIRPFEYAYKHDITLREYQSKALRGLVSHSEGVLSAPAGSGKTIIGIAAILTCGQKSLWITHTKQLLFQFVDRLKSLVNIPESDIGLIYNGDWDTEKPITAALVQTLKTDNKKLASISNNYGTIIADEVHHQPSSTFTEVVTMLNPYYLYGLTATPFRRDGLETLLFQNIGPIRHTIDRSETSSNIIVPTVIKRMLKTSNLPEELTYQTLLALLTKDDYRNSIICTDVVREAKLGNICIVLTERVSHAEILYKKILKQWDKVGIIHGKHSDKLREKTLTSLNNGEITVLTATTQLLGEGFDHPSLNRLFLAQPIRNPAKCEQLVGRVQRTSPGKVDALIYDYIDDHGLTKHQFQNYGTGSSRYNVYKKLGCNIK